MLDKPKYKIHETDSNMLLKPILREACQKHKIPEDVQAQLIVEGIKQFSIFSDGSVMPTGRYNSVEQFIEKQQHNKPQASSPAKSTKDLLLEKLASHATDGNMSAYRACRKQYSDCS